MRFIVMHKVDSNMEAGNPPSKDLIEKMGALVQGSLKTGVFTNGAGLHRSARRKRLTRKGDAEAVTSGPYAGHNELVASFAMISANSMDAALGHARRLAADLGDVEIEVGPVVEPWDLGVMAKPAGHTRERFLLLCKASAEDERGARPSEKHRAALAKLAAGFNDDGVLLASDTLAPSSKGARLATEPKGKRSWIDGPFTESKELIAGFSLLQLPSKADAIEWANRYAAILGDNEVDVREVDVAPGS